MAYAAWAGVNVLELWDMTYREIHAVMAGHNKRLLHDSRMATIIAWKTANYTRAKKIPPLDKELKRFDEPKPMKPMSARELRNAIIAANSAMGGKVTYRPKAKPPES